MQQKQRPSFLLCFLHHLEPYVDGHRAARGCDLVPPALWDENSLCFRREHDMRASGGENNIPPGCFALVFQIPGAGLGQRTWRPNSSYTDSIHKETRPGYTRHTRVETTSTRSVLPSSV